MGTGDYTVKRGLKGKRVTYACPHCSTPLESPLEESGDKFPCPECQREVVTPGAVELAAQRAKVVAAEKAKADAESVKLKARSAAEGPTVKLTYAQSEALKSVLLKYCVNCGTQAEPSQKYQGSTGVSIALLIFAFPLWIIYEIWRNSAAKYVCPNCGQAGMLPLGSPAVPRGQPMATPPYIPTATIYDGPGEFQIIGVNRATKADTVWSCRADSEANARVKADLEGIVVTRVSRL